MTTLALLFATGALTARGVILLVVLYRAHRGVLLPEHHEEGPDL